MRLSLVCKCPLQGRSLITSCHHIAVESSNHSPECESSLRLILALCFGTLLKQDGKGPTF